jgi:hypothetical protein
MTVRDNDIDRDTEPFVDSLSPEEAAKAADSGANRDPLSGEVGAHPIGVGLGAAAGGMAVGAAVGTVAGPIGTAIGALFGAIAGGLVGKGAAEMVDPTADDAYWRANYAQRAYAADHEWEDVAPAYRYGVNHYNRNVGRGFDEVEAEMGAHWETVRGSSTLAWDVARYASQDAWERARLRAVEESR